MDRQVETLFEMLRSRRLDAKSLPKTLATLPSTQLADLVDTLIRMAPTVDSEPNPKPPSLFSFVASDSLAGGSASCDDTHCRMRRARELQEFAVLYADRVLIRNPLDRMAGCREYGDTQRLDLASDLAVLWSYEPLLRAKVVAFARFNHGLCKDCARRLAIPDRAVEAVIKYLDRRSRREIALVAVKEPERFYVEFTGPDDLLYHQFGCIEYLAEIPEPLQEYARDVGRRPLPWKDARAAGFVEDMWYDVISDFVLQDWYANHFDYVYLTGRAVDTDLIDLTYDDADRPANANLTRAFRHSLPAVADLPLLQLLKLRRSSEASFRSYRNALRRALGEADLRSERRAREAFVDIVQPEIDQIEGIVQQHRRASAKRLIRDVLLYAGLVTTGLFSGLLPPSLSSVVGALGGLTGFGSAAKSALDMATIPEAARQNPYFFLWQTNRAAGHHRKSG